MLSNNYHLQVIKQRLLIFIPTTIIFIVAFVINIDMNQPLYNVNLNQVPAWQQSPIWSNNHFLTFMNVISNLFNPLVCAAYVILFFLISYRKLQILVFLIWFIFLTWILSLLKMIFHQARPYWIQESGIQMLEWICYTEYGMPSGHSMMALILMQFIVRFFSKISKCVSKCIGLFYILIIFLQICVMFSRVILGMHSLNQVLIGCLLGCFSFIPYYLFVQTLILKWIISIFQSQRSSQTNLILLCVSLFVLAAELLISLLIDYNNFTYIAVINSISGCDGFNIAKSFQYKCLEDSALIMAAIGILTAFNYMNNPSHLNMQPQYSKISFKFLTKFILTIILPGIVLAIFLNPLWLRIQVQTLGMGLIIWACQVVGFSLATFVLIYLVPIVSKKLGLQVYKTPQNFSSFKKSKSNSIEFQKNFRLSKLLIKNNRETEMTEIDKTIQIALVSNKIVKSPQYGLQ